MSYGDVIRGTFEVYPVTCTTVGIVPTIVDTINGSTLPLIILCALTSMLSRSLFILEAQVPPSSTLFFLLKTFLRKSTTTFFLFSSVVFISSIVLLTLVDGQ